MQAGSVRSRWIAQDRRKTGRESGDGSGSRAAWPWRCLAWPPASVNRPGARGPDGRGWQFGRSVHEHDLIPVLQRPGLDTTVRPRVHLFTADQQTWDRTEVDFVHVSEHGLPFSYDHQVLVTTP